MNKKTHFRIFICCIGAFALLGTSGTQGSCANNRAGEPGIDVGGTVGALWDMTYSNTVTVTVKNAGAVVSTGTYTVGAGGVFDVDGTMIDLTNFCARADVVCPQDVFPTTVELTQPGSQLHLLYTQFNHEGPLGNVQEVTLLGNVDSDDAFSVFLGVTAAATGVCGLLGASVAQGTIEADPLDDERGISMSGEIITAYSGGCAVVGTGGVAAAGITVELRIPFTGLRQ